MVSTKVNLCSTNELRNAVDDRLPEVLSHLGYTQDFSLIDRKLALGYATGILAAAAFALDKKLGFKAAYTATVALLVVYGLTLGAYYYFTATIERSIKYVGQAQNGTKDRVTISTVVKDKYVPVLTVEVSLNGKASSKEVSMTSLFLETGYLELPALIALIKGELAALTGKTE